MTTLSNHQYPAWICRECAEARGHRNRCQLSTYHEDECGWCKRVAIVTQPRDYGYPPFKNDSVNK